MTWSVSAKGTKKQVKEIIKKQVGSSDNHESAMAGLIALVDDQKGSVITISGSGHDNAATLSISSGDQT